MNSDDFKHKIEANHVRFEDLLLRMLYVLLLSCSYEFLLFLCKKEKMLLRFTAECSNIFSR